MSTGRKKKEQLCRVSRRGMGVLAGMVALALAVPAVSQTADVAKPPEAATRAAGDVWAVTSALSRGGQADIAAKGPFAAMGKLAGQKAKEACKDRKPDLVLVFAFHWAAKTDEDRKQILDGVTESFDKAIVYGMSSGIPSNLGDQRASVGVIALGGVTHTAVKAKIEPGREDAAYAAVAEGLKAP